MFWTNFHSHTIFCDGTDKPEVYLQSAINQKLKVYGFSGHAPVSFPSKWAMPYHSVYKYLEEVNYLKKKYKDLIEVYVGMEVDYIPGLTGPYSDFIRSLKMDYVIGSIHFVDKFKNGQDWKIDST